MAFWDNGSHASVINKVERVFENIVDSLLREDVISIPLKCKRSRSTISAQGDSELSAKLTYISFPAKTSQEAWRFAVLFRILELIHEALTTDTIVSKRNIYYKDPSLFKSQAVVDRYVDIFAYTFGVQRTALKVSAAAKGLEAGGYSIIRPDGTEVSKGVDGKPRLIDDMNDVIDIDTSGVSWIVVIEKESTFRTLASSLIHQTSQYGRGILLTAKGYPDISTRSFLYRLSTCYKSNTTSPPVFALTDYDPDGIAIMSTYKHGSCNLSHENASLNVRSVRWLGVKSYDVINSNDDDEKPENEHTEILRLSGTDRKRATKLLENNVVFAEDGEEQEWRREIQVMLVLNLKAEMELLAERDGGVEGWVERKLGELIGGS